MQILSPSRRSWRASRRDGLRRGLRLGERVCGRAAEDSTLLHARVGVRPLSNPGSKGGFRADGLLSGGAPRYAYPGSAAGSGHARPGRLTVLRSCALKPVGSARRFE